MKKGLLFCFLIFGLIYYASAQNDAYVIEQPDNQLKNNFEKLKNPDYTSYLLSSSSFTLKKREIRIVNTDIIFAKGSYGLTDNTTASLSISLIGTLVASIKQQIKINCNSSHGPPFNKLIFHNNMKQPIIGEI